MHVGFEPVVKAIATEGVTVPLTVIEIALDVAFVGLMQVALEVKIQVIISLFVIVLGVKVVAFVPAFAPFTFH